MSILIKIVRPFQKYPVLRGIGTYAILWPTSSLIQQSFQGKNMDSYDWWKCARFGLYGSCYVAPTLYTWMRIAQHVWPLNTFKYNVIKVLVEQLSYGPFAICSFYFVMSLLELKTFNEAVDEVKLKFWPTYKLGACVWPSIAMFNFCVIPPRNRVPFISGCSVIWTCYLAYMKQLEIEQVASKTSHIEPIKEKHL